MAEIIHAFAHHQNRTMVNNVARMMVASGSDSCAEAELVFNLNVIWDVLEARGLAEEVIEAECHLFCRAAWQRYDELIVGAGAA
ncbi:hypothetical protein [Bradyrhizobium vignae]|uniref:hypothetical protein n=1 Tax=Bradyrhizobium vignae TaxID=1549949 RepID=UPI00100A6DF7|nr:hypothetical protein [Bradyrhizobium vignae]RXG92277.1 hypothetical protein EAV90_27215 [Bradyrhizobium vignae]